MDKSPEAIALVLESLRPRILSQFAPRIERLIGSRSDGQDLFQMVALKVLRSAHQFRGETEDDLNGWVMTIALTTASRLLSSNLRCQNRSAKREAFQLDRSDWVAELRDEAQAQVEVREEAEYVLGRMAVLCPRQRDAVTLYYLEGLTHAELAERLGCTNQAARLLVSRGLSAIRNHFRKSETQAAAS